jgi:NitT/TauT family transport system substrate-binding protein
VTELGISLKRIAALPVLFALLSLPGIPAAEAALPGKLTPLRAVVLPYITFAPFFIARDEGYFEAEGLDVEFVRLVQPMAGVSEVAKGAIDMTQVGTRVGIFNAMLRGAKLRIVADKGGFAGESSPSSGFLVRRDLLDGKGKPDWAKIKGRKVSVDPSSFWGFLFEKYLASNGLKMSDFVIEDLPVTALPGAFGTGTVAIAHVSEPWLTKILGQETTRLLVSDAGLAPAAHFSGVCFGPSLLEGNPDAGVRFMVAYLKGVRQYNRGKTKRNIEIIAGNTGLDTGIVADSAWPVIRSDGAMNLSGFVEFQKWARKKGYLDSVVPAEKLWDPRFVEQANRKLGGKAP